MHTPQALLVIIVATRRYLQRRYGARLASLAPSSTQAQQVWGAWHAASRQHQNRDSAGGSRAPCPPPAKSIAWQAFLLDLEPTDPEWDARQQGHLLLQGLLTSSYPASCSFCLLPVAAGSEEGPAAAGGAAAGIHAAEAPSSRAEGGPAVAPEHATLPLLSEVVISSSSSAGPQAQLQRPPDLSGQDAAAGKPSAHAKGLSTAARLLPDVAAVLCQLLMAEAGALAGRSIALRLLAKHVENRAAALVNQAEDLALEVQRRRPVSMQQGVHELLCHERCPQPIEAGQQLLQPLTHARPQQAAPAAQRAQRASMCPQGQASRSMLVQHAKRRALEVQRQLHWVGEYMQRAFL